MMDGDMAQRRVAYQAMVPPAPPWEGLSRRQQQVLTHLLARAIAGMPRATEVQVPEVQGWFEQPGGVRRAGK
jgi:hypothetical protein